MMILIPSSSSHLQIISSTNINFFDFSTPIPPSFTFWLQRLLLATTTAASPTAILVFYFISGSNLAIYNNGWYLTLSISIPITENPWSSPLSENNANHYSTNALWFRIK